MPSGCDTYHPLVPEKFREPEPLVNHMELGRDVALPQPTVHRYLNLLETSYLLVRVPAYSVNRTKRLIKSPKLY